MQIMIGIIKQQPNSQEVEEHSRITDASKRVKCKKCKIHTIRRWFDRAPWAHQKSDPFGSLHLASSSRTEWPSSRVVNLVTVDAEALAAAAPFAHHAWSSVLEIVIALSLIYITIGPPVLAAVIIMILYIPFNYCCSSIISSYQVVHGISVVKMYAWEEAFGKEILRLRKEEVRFLKWATLVTRILQAVNSAAPFLVAIACFSWFVLSSSKNILQPSIAFVALTVFNQLRRPMSLIAPAIQFITKAAVCSKRINDFLQADELKKEKEPEKNFQISIILRNACFSWNDQKEHLRDVRLLLITFKVHEGKLHAVVGPVGCGKSSLLAAILGEMNHLNGFRKVNGTIAYVSQTPWILNHTVRANILYGLEYDKNKYDKDSDIYLLDEPFSAVDATIAGSMYEKLFGPDGLLTKKTVILVTHSIGFTKTATLIHVMDDGGRIIDEGTYSELLERSQMFSKIKQDHEQAKKEGRCQKTSVVNRQRRLKVMFEPPQPIDSDQLENVAVGRVKISVYLAYLRAFSYGWALVFLILLLCRYAMQDVDIIDIALPINIRLVVDSLMHVLVCSVMVSIFHVMGLITTGEVGLCISYALSTLEQLVTVYRSMRSVLLYQSTNSKGMEGPLTDLMNYSVRIMALTETNIVSVERVKEYHDIESEVGGPYTSDYPLIDAWPHSGAIEFRNFSIRCGNSEKLALKNLTLSIKGGEKVAIIGRTGSGKTTIAKGLLRLVEKASGDVFIDGVNIADLGLHELRTRITIIPQDPVLFSSTLRFNVDPFNQFPDSDIWLALEACQLKQMVAKQEDGLMFEIEEGGKNIRFYV
ncbi:hypothetical protein KIN20_000262 [Parelaphostrongylus tenuis]|uniref:Uncharacterized protein n=1 Tax=Parelaphostrongylus tenuis TaxID=148309 RepID=A0AAD5QBD5_PARTN|nr:hypothetical protein KIN20_000262 [Parelaphostrongylus tenuis]